MTQTTYDKILDAAVEIFAERGYSGTSMREIAEALHITKAALYYHFRGKDEIFMACLSRPLDTIVQELEILSTEDLSFWEKFQNMNRKMLHFSSQHPHTFRLFKMIASQNFDLEISKKIFHNYFKRMKNAIRSMVEKGIKDGELRNDVPLDLQTSAISGILHHTTVPTSKQRTALPSEQEEQIHYLLQLIKGGFSSL